MEANNQVSQDNNLNSSSEDALSSEHTDILLQFQDLTRIEDLERCRAILESLQWNLEEAVRTFSFEEEELGESSEISGNQSTSNLLIGPELNSNRSSNTPSEVPDLPEDDREPEQSNQLSLFGGIFQLISYPISLVYDTLVSLIRFTWSLIRPDPRRFVTDPVADVIKFIKSFEETFGLSHPVFYRGAYSSALSDAKRELKYLLVYLHNENHLNTDHFCRNVLTHPEVSNYLNRNNLLFWACSVNNPEGYRVSLALREGTYPFLALIVLKENRMTVVKRFEGKSSVERLLSQLQQSINDSEAYLIAARAERQERSMNQKLREEQDEAYAQSLKEDQEKEKRKNKERMEKEKEDKMKKEKEKEESERRENLLNLKLDLAAMIPPEPEARNPDVIRIVIKLPDGTRLERRFIKTQSIKYLYYFVFCQDKSPLHFQITKNFPRKELPCKSPSIENPKCLSEESQDDPPSFQQIGLGKSEMLFVSDLEA